MLLLLLVCTTWSAGFPKAVPTQTRQLWVQRSYELFAFTVVFVGFGSVVCGCVGVCIFVGFLLDLYFFSLS